MTISRVTRSGRGHGQLQPDRPAEGHARVGEAVDPELVEQPPDVVGQVGHRVRAGHDGRAAVSAEVEADHAVVVGQRPRLGVEQAEVRAQ